MNLRGISPHDVPLRLATGAFILNSGIKKLGLDEAGAAGLQGLAANASPLVNSIPVATFGRILAGVEITLGTALLTPVVPSAIAGAGLTAFSGGLLTMYARTPGMHEPGSLRPTQAGTALAKDVWMLGTGLSLLIDGLTRRREAEVE